MFEKELIQDINESKHKKEVLKLLFKKERTKNEMMEILKIKSLELSRILRFLRKNDLIESHMSFDHHVFEYYIAKDGVILLTMLNSENNND
ncbi:MAG: ArsR family transcriptional regulator [Methanobrevibacter arboriphilus]|jgi:transcription initiation factor IIE alpha subunit|uniref:Uncharacterized protein n=2 Tax=Methanobrevibacter arboriphilus TaxID=39441 RepID=A0ACA8R5Z2_METAZ|nr:ArsR family transcriptional regulator [Methanobrevibacter arboriphilus]MBF4467793.1 ArsR family transcriptional regulator [Methanobrevibacter arboriphilus]MCC7562844.1 ArsR family transcriptional regulator [Methanobrevibacter arboriphilus]BBL62949.1 hypothetical protein MarbSA_19890 [Methanobrevibacter arboriphilus]GLI12165.1 hypothetical protein MARBORIA2_12550 [Methanobrevibacter arboriphilus]